MSAEAVFTVVKAYPTTKSGRDPFSLPFSLLDGIDHAPKNDFLSGSDVSARRFARSAQASMTRGCAGKVYCIIFMSQRPFRVTVHTRGSRYVVSR